MFSRIHSIKKYAWALAFVAFAGTPLSLNVQEIAPIHISVAQAQTQDASKASTNIADFNKRAAGETVGTCSWYEFKCSVAAGIIQLIGRSALTIASWFVSLTGFFFDASIKLFVAEFGNYYELIKPLLTQMWGLVRDLCNLAFIFGFIYIGIKTIIDPDNASTKRFLSSIIIGAIFINFSLYLVQLIIDISNFLAVTIYNAIIGTSSVTIAGKIVGVLGLSSIWNSTLGSPLQSSLLDNPTLAFAFFTGSALFLLIAAFVLAAGALLILIRFIELILIMIFSPLIFGARVFPQTEPVSKKILGKLFSTAFFVPVYLFMLYISLQFAQKFSDAFATNQAFNKVFLNENGDGMGVAILLDVNYIIIIFLLIQSLLLSLKIGATGAGMAISVGNNMKNRAQNGLKKGTRYVAGGAAGMAGRGAVRALNAGAQRVGIGNLRDVGARTEKYRQEMRGSTRTGMAGFIDRNIKGRLVGAAGAAAGAAGTGLTEMKFGSQHSVKSKDDEDKKYTKAYENRMQEQENNTKFEEALKNVADPTKDLAKAAKDIADSMKKMSNEKIAGMSQAQLTNARIAANLTDDQMKHLKETKSKAEYDAIEKARKDAQAHIAEHGDAVYTAAQVNARFVANAPAGQSRAVTARIIANHNRTTRQKILQGDPEKINIEYFTNPAMAAQMLPNMDPEKLEKRLAVGDVDATQKDAIRDNLDAYIALLKARTTPTSTRQLNVWTKKIGEKFELSNLGVTI